MGDIKQFLTKNSNMKRYAYICPTFLILLLIFSANVKGDTSDVIAQGRLTVDGSTVEISHVVADEDEGDITVIVSDNPIPPESVPDDVYNLGAAGEFQGIVFVVSRETKNIEKEGYYKLINAVHFYPTWTQLGSIGNGEITISKLDDKILSGRIFTPSEDNLAGHTFSYDISFSVSLEKDTSEIQDS